MHGGIFLAYLLPAIGMQQSRVVAYNERYQMRHLRTSSRAAAFVRRKNMNTTGTSVFRILKLARRDQPRAGFPIYMQWPLPLNFRHIKYH